MVSSIISDSSSILGLALTVCLALCLHVPQPELTFVGGLGNFFPLPTIAAFCTHGIQSSAGTGEAEHSVSSRP